MDDLLRELLDCLDVVADEHEEIYDTVCREKMGDAIFYLILKSHDGYTMPDDFGLYSHDANQQVKAALAQYVSAAITAARAMNLTTFHQRLSAFQNGDVRSTVAGNNYDDYFGWWNPANFDDTGSAIGQA